MELCDYYKIQLIIGSAAPSASGSSGRKGIGQTSTAYTLNRGVANVGAEEVRQTGNVQVKIIHTVPDMTETERDAAKKRIGSDLYEIFMRIQAELRIDNEFID